MNLTKTIITAGVLAALSGCATSLQKMELKPDQVRTEAQAAASAQAGADWTEPALRAEGRASVVLMTPMSLPESVQKKKLSLELQPGATVSDVVAVLGRLGHSIILADDEAGQKTFFVPRYDGNLGGFLSALSRVTDVWFTWHDGTVVVSSKEKIAVSIPQESGFAETVQKGLQSLGLEGHAVSWEAGMVTLQVAPSQLQKVKAYLERMSNNAAVVTLQVAIVNVSLDQTAKQGVDWEGLSVAVGRGAQGYSSGLFGKEVAAVDPLAPPTATGSTLVAAANSLLMSGGTLKGLVTAHNFSLNAMFDFLQKYGVTETRQNAKLSTATGKEVVLKSLTQIPYVAEITNSATTNTSNTTNTGSARTERADDGIEVKMTPSYDAANQTVTIGFSLALKSVIAFNELKAGNALGTITQPTTSERSFSDVVRVRPGSTVVIGGLTYDQVSDNRGLPVFLQQGSQLESQSLKITRQTMFVVIRPTVEVLGAVQVKKEGDELFPRGAEVAPEHVPQKKKAEAVARKPEQKSASAPSSAPQKAVGKAPSAEAASVSQPKAEPKAEPKVEPKVEPKATAGTPVQPVSPVAAASAPTGPAIFKAPAQNPRAKRAPVRTGEYLPLKD